MTERDTSWQTLNAYVDGELDSREAAEIARFAGQDPAIAEQISLLYHVKGGVHAEPPSVPADLADVLPPPPSRQPRRRIGALAAAAVVCALLAGSLVWVYGTAREGGDTFIASARVLHDRWLVDEMQNATVTPPTILAALSRFGRLPVVPDLESTGLSVGLVSASDHGDGRVLQIGYRGHHGCHLSLFVSTSAFSGPTEPDLGSLERSYSWQVGDLGYLLYAEGMDKSRFALIAEKVEHATRVNAPLDERARQQLAENKRRSTPCSA